MDYLFYTGLLLFISGVNAVIKSAPLNAVAEVGQQVIFNCTSDTTLQNWILTAKREDLGTAALQNIAINCLVQPAFATHYDVDRPGGNTNICNLIVKNTTMQQAGIYTCTDTTNGPSAILTVIDAFQNATYNTTEGVVVEKDTVIIECLLNYNGSMPPAPTLRPYFYWTDSNGQNVSSPYDSTTENATVSQLTVTAGRQDITPYMCHVSLQLLPSTNTGYASNIPTVSNHATSSIIKVQYSASTPNITSSSVNCSTIVLTCNSSGHPAPNYTWVLWNTTFNHGTINGQNLTTSEVNQSYTCNAYNTIRNYTHNSFANGTISESNYTSNCNELSPGTTDLLATILLAAILGGYGLCNIIATIAFMVYYNHRANTMNGENGMSPFKNKAKLNARFSWLQRMLPCMNESRGNAGCTFMWVMLFILMSILTGIIVFPILIAIVNCSRKSKNSKVSENSDIGMRNIDIDDDCQEYTRTSATPSTAAHGDIVNPYETVGTVRFHPVKTSEEDPDSTKSNNVTEPRKVLYTKVNPNLSSGEEVERYGISPPGQSPES